MDGRVRVVKMFENENTKESFDMISDEKQEQINFISSYFHTLDFDRENGDIRNNFFMAYEFFMMNFLISQILVLKSPSLEKEAQEMREAWDILNQKFSGIVFYDLMYENWEEIIKPREVNEKMKKSIKIVDEIYGKLDEVFRDHLDNFRHAQEMRVRDCERIFGI